MAVDSKQLRNQVKDCPLKTLIKLMATTKKDLRDTITRISTSISKITTKTATILGLTSIITTISRREGDLATHHEEVVSSIPETSSSSNKEGNINTRMMEIMDSKINQEEMELEAKTSSSTRLAQVATSLTLTSMLLVLQVVRLRRIPASKSNLKVSQDQREHLTQPFTKLEIDSFKLQLKMKKVKS
jgi:hypothetical protein